MTPITLQTIKQTLQDCFSPLVLEVEDQSAYHKGHVGAKEGEITHIKITLSAPCLAGLSMIDQHRRVYASLDAGGHHLHAVSIKIINTK